MSGQLMTLCERTHASSMRSEKRCWQTEPPPDAAERAAAELDTVVFRGIASDESEYLYDKHRRGYIEEAIDIIRRNVAEDNAEKDAEIERLRKKGAALESIGDDLRAHALAECGCDDGLTCGACVDILRWNRAKEDKA